VAERFTCPFHGWSYDLTGSLLDVEAPAGRRRLGSLPLDLWNGWVFTCLSRRAPAPLREWLPSSLGSGVEELTLLHSATHEVHRRWSDLTELPSTADEHTVVIEPAISVLRFRRGLVTTHALTPTGPGASRWMISWYLRRAEHGLTVDELQGLISRDRHELRESPGCRVIRWPARCSTGPLEMVAPWLPSETSMTSTAA
jgi:hypothetical protein